MNTKVVETKASTSLDHAVSTYPYSTYAILEWYTTNIIPKARWRYLQILFQFLDMFPIHSAVSYTLPTFFGIHRRLVRAILYTYRLVTFHLHICPWLFLNVRKVLAYINSSFFFLRQIIQNFKNIQSNFVKI